MNRLGEMRILHISDLHFGAHDRNLEEALKRHIRRLKPDVIVMSGDLVDEPDEGLFASGTAYLRSLEGLCTERPFDDANRPRVICVPGNHDVLPAGYQPRRQQWLFGALAWWGALITGEKRSRSRLEKLVDYRQHFEGFARDYFFFPEKVWIFGFDSAGAGGVGGGGVVADEDLDAFHRRFEELREAHGRSFTESFKIAVVHHHPLPVNWDPNWKQRFLTMNNSGRFLAGILHRKVDLVLHGHEHLQANARLSSSLGGNEWETVVESVGSALVREEHGRNWFNLITLSANGAVQVACFPGIGQDFSEDAQMRTIRPATMARDAAFERWKRESGSVYQGVTSVTRLHRDGDAWRTVECNQLTILSADAERGRDHALEFPYTAGYIDLVNVKAATDSEPAGIYFEGPALNRAERPRSLQRTIRWDRQLQAQEKISYQYSWVAVNGFAMDARQFDYKYRNGGGARMEFTHFVVNDPVEDLLIVVQFPDGHSLAGRPEIRVARYDGGVDARRWVREAATETALRESGALQYVRTIQTAALRIRRPEKGLSYGVQWRVPDSAARKEGAEAVTIRGLVEFFSTADLEAENVERVIVDLLGKITPSVRQAFDLVAWEGTLETSFMVFLPATGQLKLVATVCTKLHRGKHRLWHAERGKQSNPVVDYGDGISGRAFKANEGRFYLRPAEAEKEPYYYRTIDGEKPHAIFLSLPVHSPVDTKNAYGVLNISSHDAACPLCSSILAATHSADAFDHTSASGCALAALQLEVSAVFFQGLTREFL